MLAPLVLLLACVLVHAGCSCVTYQAVRDDVVRFSACVPQHAIRATVRGKAPEIETVSAGTPTGQFSVTSSGEAQWSLPLWAPPGRAGIEPRLALTYRSSGAEGTLGAGFSLTGASSIARCAKNLAQDGEIRGVRYDGGDKLCLDGRPLVVVGGAPGQIEYRTIPDSHTKVIGHDPDEEGTPRWWEAFDPSGLITEYGTEEGSRPLGPGGVTRVWLATTLRDGRGNAMTYGYCFATAAEGHTAEYALDEVRYTRFDGEPAQEASRAVKLVYGLKNPDSIRWHRSAGMILQSALRLDQLQWVGPGETLVRSVQLGYAESPVTHRTLLTHVEECAPGGSSAASQDQVCLPPTRFEYDAGETGFREHPTGLSAPFSRRASPLVMDIDGDGLSDLVVPDGDPGYTTPGQPITRWWVAHNEGPEASQPYLGPFTLGISQEWVTVQDPESPADPAQIQPELGTAIDYNQDGRQDILLHGVDSSNGTWEVLLSRPDRTFERHDTGLRRPFPLAVAMGSPALATPGASMHLADVNGDHVPDVIQCEDHGDSPEGDPGGAVWKAHLWQPKTAEKPFGFDPDGEPIRALATVRCDMEVHTLDLDGDGKVELVVPLPRVGADGSELASDTYDALSRLENGLWSVRDTRLRGRPEGGRVVFLDVNGDGLPDAVHGGYSDGALRTTVNRGGVFASLPIFSLGARGYGGQDAYFDLAVVLDDNGDGRQDLLVPILAFQFEGSNEVPHWAILEALPGSQDSATFRLVDPHIPLEEALGEAALSGAEIGTPITLADPRVPRSGDFNGDGKSDVLVLLGGEFHLFESLASASDELVSISEGNNAHDPADPELVPSIKISYGRLIDASITKSLGPGDPALESETYLSRANPANDCVYPRRCAVGPRRVVSGYELDDGAGGARRFSVRYRDGRFDMLGNGFLGFGQRLVTDMDTGATTADFYDNVAFDEEHRVFPFAHQIEQQWRWAPALPGEPSPDKIELSFLEVRRELFPTNGGASYFTLPTRTRLRRAQGSYFSGSSQSTEAYAAQVESGGGGATLLRDTTAKATDIDEFGHVLAENVTTAGVDLTRSIARTFKNDTGRWVLGQLQSQTECSAAALWRSCRTLARTTTPFGEVETESISTGDNSPETKLDVVYSRDRYGNVTGVVADDAFGHHRTATIQYEPEGIFPREYVDAAGHTSLTEFDAGLGVVTQRTDPNGLVTTWKHDGFGRIGREERPDGTQTTITLQRTKDGGPSRNAWRVRKRTVTSGGADDEVELDSLGRPVQAWWHGPATPRPEGLPARLTQQVTYDPRTGQVARRSVPVSEGTPEDQWLFDTFELDALGRETRHIAPWGAVTETVYDGFLVEVTDALGNVTVSEQDPLGRLVSVTDAAQGLTSYTYGPFGTLYTVTDPGGAVLRTTRDALGRVRKVDDPDRGTTVQVHNGFGELLSSTDALGRKLTLQRDAMGRVEKRIDESGAELLITSWTWDTAPNGIGKLHELASPDGVKTYAYDSVGRLESLSLEVNGESEPFTTELGYDAFSRVDTIAYPVPAGAPPFVVSQAHDAYGHVLEVKNPASSQAYWRLTDVDNAGRFRREVFGNESTTERSYFAAKQRLKSLVTESGLGPGGPSLVQDLTYDYDARLSLVRRTDALQVKHPTERFRYDPLERLTCAYFGTLPDPAAPCDTSYGYAPNGNLTFKSDVGALSYGDSAHPHAATTAGNDGFGYNAVGNQISRPGGTTVEYTPFDLPRTITEPTGTATFGYDGDEQRIRKTTPLAETLYFADLYERATEMASGATEHRYYVHSPERVVAIVTRGGTKPGTLYVHADHLGSVDALTDTAGKVVERRSYDAFGQRRNPIWGDPSPPSFTEKTTLGFTGHESDGELGLVNMKGRVYDPKLGRFLTTDPVISDLSLGQALNPYSYVFNNPLNYVDPSGFEGDSVKPEPGVLLLPQDTIFGPPPARGPPTSGAPHPEDAQHVGAAAPATDTGRTGNPPAPAPPPTSPAEPDKTDNGLLASMAWGAAKQLLGSLPPVAAIRQIGLNVDIATTAAGQAVGGDLPLALNTLLEIPERNAEQAARVLTAPIDAARSIPGAVSLAMSDSVDPEMRGAAAVQAAQATAAVVTTVAGAVQARARGMNAPPKSGETAATAAGRGAHKAWTPPSGFQKEYTLPSGRRADAINFKTREVIELKPNNPGAIRKGQRQVAEYVKELEAATGQKWIGRVETYP